MQHDLGDGVILHTSDEWRFLNGTNVCTPRFASMEPRADRDVTEFIVHHTGGANLGADEPREWLRNIFNYHTRSRKYSDIAYNSAVTHKGEIFECRDNHFVGAHTLANPPDGINHNRVGTGAVFMRTEDGLTDKAKLAYRKLYGLANLVSGRTLHKMVHSDVSSTACPGEDLKAFVKGDMGMAAPRPDVPAAAAIAWPDIPYPGHLVKKGSVGGDVLSVQKRLLEQKFGPGPLDGKFGPRTEDAVKRFQRSRNLGVDGIVGPITWEALF